MYKGQYTEDYLVHLTHLLTRCVNQLKLCHSMVYIECVVE